MSCYEGHGFYVLSTHGPLSSIMTTFNMWFCVVILIHFDSLWSVKL